jgi:UTP--glucose-1-phosphate uridylyltransferase
MNAFQSIRKAVFPVAGLGSRFLPATKAIAKEMLPIVDKPLIQYAAEEAIEAGITELVFVTGRTKRAIEDHFDKAYELETELAAKQKHDLLALVRNVIPPGITCAYVRQAEPLGLGHAVLCAKPVVGNEPFAVLLADDLMVGKPGALKQMVDVAAQHGASVLCTEEVARDKTASYGIVTPQERLGSDTHAISSIVEKPQPAVAPLVDGKAYGVIGRYVLSPRIFQLLEGVGKGAGGEIQLTDGISALLAHERVLAHHVKAQRFDCGSKLGYLQATVSLGMQHAEVGAAFTEYLKGVRT